MLILAVMVLSLAGCDLDDDDDKTTAEDTAPEKKVSDYLMVVTSPALKYDDKGEKSYRLYRGDQVKVEGTDAKYYVAPLAEEGDDPVTMNLLFAEKLSEDLPFIITTADEDYAVVLSYNPNGKYFSDITTPYGSVRRAGGLSQRMSYGGLIIKGASVSSSALDFDSSDETKIILNDNAAYIDDSTTPVNDYEYIWHTDPYHSSEYYTNGQDSTDELTEEEMLSAISQGTDEEEFIAYVAHDIRYMTNEDIYFQGILKNNGKTEYAAYYSEEVFDEVAEGTGSTVTGPYIFATLPATDGDNTSGALRNSQIAAFSTMTHSPEEAYENQVLHIVKPGTYRLSGRWLGQVMLDPGTDGDITLILDGVTISCDVAPAIVFRNVRECDPSGSAINVPSGAGNTLKSGAGAKLVIANKSENSISGTNIYRILKPEKNNDSITDIDGSASSQQKTLYKMDGAIHSYVSLAIGAESNGSTGSLSITSKAYDGISTEQHLLIDGGVITVTAENDGINASAGGSVFTMGNGSLTVTAKEGEGIDSGGCIVLDMGTLDITSGTDSDELSAEGGPMRADKGVYMSDNVTYIHQGYSGDDEKEEETGTGAGGIDWVGKPMTKKTVNVYDPNTREVLLRLNFKKPVKDEDDTLRMVPRKGEVFTLERQVNSFSGVKGE